MPSVLMLFFILALVITGAGLLLSPRSSARSPQNEYLVTPKGRRIVEAPPTRTRSKRLNEGAGAGEVKQRVRGGSVNVNPVRRRGGALVVNPGRWERQAGRVGSWKYFIPGLVAIFVLGLYLFSMVFPHSAVWTFVSFGQPVSTPSSNTTNQATYTASQHLTRLNQLDPAQYRSMQEYALWSDSTCSTATMTEVINSYGHQYRITDILQIESGLGEITPQLGLLEDVGIQRTAAKLGFKTAWGHTLSLDQVIAAANSGTPVIVSFPPSRLPPGHLVVVRGGDSNYVYLADSSARNWTQLTHARFMQLWAGFSAILTPA